MLFSYLRFQRNIPQKMKVREWKWKWEWKCSGSGSASRPGHGSEVKKEISVITQVSKALLGLNVSITFIIRTSVLLSLPTHLFKLQVSTFSSQLQKVCGTHKILTIQVAKRQLHLIVKQLPLPRCLTTSFNKTLLLVCTQTCTNYLVF